MAEIVYVNGEYVDRKDAKISVFDHGFLYGDGVFEGIRFYKRNLFKLREHLERLYSSAKYILLDIGRSIDDLTELVIETCRKNDLDDGYIRLVVSRGEGTLGLNPYHCSNPGLIIIVSKIQLYPEEFYTNGLPIITASTRRFGTDTVSPRVKSLNYLNNILAKVEAVHAGVQEALMLDRNGLVVECTGDNFFIVKRGAVYTPPTYQGALRGVTRDVVIELAKKRGIEVREERMTLYECYDADECFLTGTAAQVVPVSDIDHRIIGNGRPGDITKVLMEDFNKVTTVDGVKF
ncbi:MAG: branched-chain-amino-acid transaminase [Candidatus Sumerlaeia bacterium]|nr:branched-chain-amino-acid transaminase [Candidatus Sumerlaeia bacterium]